MLIFVQYLTLLKELIFTRMASKNRFPKQKTELKFQHDCTKQEPKTGKKSRRKQEKKTRKNRPNLSPKTRAKRQKSRAISCSASAKI